MAVNERERGLRSQARVAIAATLALALLVVAILLLLPPSIATMLEDVLGYPDGTVYPLISAEARTPGRPAAAEDDRLVLDIAIVSVDELQRQAALRVSGQRLCAARCAANEQLVLFSLGAGEEGRFGLPPSATVPLPPNAAEVTRSVALPVIGHPIRYPFDSYDLRLGVGLERIRDDGSIEAMPRDQAARQLSISLQEQLSRQSMDPPRPVDLAALPRSAAAFDYLSAVELRFSRPLYLRVLAVLLVVLVAAAATYAVVMRPLHDFFINFGGVVLGVWGVRSVLVPSTASFVTAVDLALSLVILFMLGAIAVRSLAFAHMRSGLPPRRLYGAREEPSD